jgi:hypothetical protein
MMKNVSIYLNDIEIPDQGALVLRLVWAILWKRSSNKQRARTLREMDRYSNVRRIKREDELVRRKMDKLVAKTVK